MDLKVFIHSHFVLLPLGLWWNRTLWQEHIMQETAYIIVFWNKKGDPNIPLCGTTIVTPHYATLLEVCQL